MSKSVISIDTSQAAPHAGSHVWASALAKLCGRFQIDSLGSPTVDGHVDYLDLGRLRLCQIEVSRHQVALPSDWSNRDAHPVVKVLFQTQGESVFEQNGRTIKVSPGDCLAYDVSRPHKITSSALTKHDVVIIPRDLVLKRGVPLHRIDAQLLSSRGGAVHLAHDFAKSVIRENLSLSPEAELRLAGVLLDLVFLPLYCDEERRFNIPAVEQLKNRAIRFINENLRDPELSITKIADALNCTTRYLHMSFNDGNESISECIWQARLERCLAELETAAVTGRSVTEIAYSWGFNSSSHFSRLFRRRFGLAPSAVKARAQLSASQ